MEIRERNPHETKIELKDADNGCNTQIHNREEAVVEQRNRNKVVRKLNKYGTVWV